LDFGGAGSFSQVTRTPTGAYEHDPYQEGTLRLRAGIGVTNFLKAELVLPLLDTVWAPNDGLGFSRFGDPTIGLTAGGKVALGRTSTLQLGPLAELTFPTARAIVLRPLPMSVLPSALDRGIVVAIGGVSATLGAMTSYHHVGASWEARLSARGFYRVRSADA